MEAAFSLQQLHSAGQAVAVGNSSTGHHHAGFTADTNGAQDSLQGRAQTAGVAQPQKQLSNPLAYEILENLQQLRWRRIDVCFRDTPLFWFSHNHLQNTRRWMNWVGEAVCKHLAAQLNAMESQIALANAPATI